MEHSQRLLVTAQEARALISLQERDEKGNWCQRLFTRGWIGKNGLGKEREGDNKTPVGSLKFLFAFGSKENPGTVFPYIKVDERHYLVDDVSSAYYNQLVEEGTVERDWNSAEHLVSMGCAYHYALATDYNKDCAPGKGSGIFLHCEQGHPTAGCISVPEPVMKAILQRVRQDCMIEIS
ncbi:MAG: S-layer protein [Lachnospiraceae bacterium]|nr:S-layer protein [Lachnospiraceae bacterium]